METFLPTAVMASPLRSPIANDAPAAFLPEKLGVRNAPPVPVNEKVSAVLSDKRSTAPVELTLTPSASRVRALLLRLKKLPEPAMFILEAVPSENTSCNSARE